MRNMLAWIGMLAVVMMMTASTWWGGPPATDAERLAEVNQMYAEYAKRFPDVPAISAEQLEAWRQEGPVTLVDVREPAERAVSIIPGAITRDELAKVPTPGRVVVYCTIGMRSGIATGELRAQGIDAYNLAGGVLAWTHVAGPLEHDGAPTHTVHVYGRTWNLAALAYKAVW